MPEKRKPHDPNSTHVLDDDDIEELEDLTLTSVIRDAMDLPESEPIEDETLPGTDDLDFDSLSPKDIK